MENTQKELLGGSDTSYLSTRDGPEISQRQINKHLEHLHWAVIYNIVHYFNSTYHVSVSADHVADNLLPQRPDLKMYENKEAHDAYHKKLRAAKIRYEDVVDQIILLLDGRSFAEQAFHELAEKCHKASWNLYKNRPEYERKKALITFNGYFCTNHHYSWQDEWTLEDKTKDILRGVAHYETGVFNLYPLGLSELLGYNRSPSNEHEFSTCKKVKGLKMFKNGRVDIRFATETDAAEFTARYLGLVP